MFHILTSVYLRGDIDKLLLHDLHNNERQEYITHYSETYYLYYLQGHTQQQQINPKCFQFKKKKKKKNAVRRYNIYCWSLVSARVDFDPPASKYTKPRISRTRVSRIFAQLGQNAAVPMMLIVFSTTNLG